MRLVFKAHGGITKVLKKKAEGKVGAKVKVWVDGPYGGVGQDLARLERVVLLAGGLGEFFFDKNNRDHISVHQRHYR